MSSTSHPKILLFKADGAIAKGVAVKIGSDAKHVTPSTAVTDFSVGISQGVATLAEDLIEVALPGGGGKALAQTTILAGELLVPHTDGSLKPTTASGNRVIGMAMEGAVAGDLFYAEVLAAVSTAAAQ